MIYERFEKIKQHIGLNSNIELARILNCNISRIKTLSSKKLAVKKFKDCEIKILSDKYGISEKWLVTGQGDFLKALSTKDLIMDEIKRMSPDRVEFYYHLMCAERLKANLSH